MSSVAVIMIHVVSHDMVQMYSSGDGSWWQAAVLGVASRWCVPVFIMLSGIFLLGTNKQETPLQFYRHRLSRLMLVLIVWGLFYRVMVPITHGARTPADFYYALLNRDYPPLSQVLLDFAEGNVYFHLWFLFALVGMYLFTPFLRVFCRNASPSMRWILIVILMILAAVSELHTSFSHDISNRLFIDLWPMYLGYFLMGHELMNVYNKGPANWMLVLVMLLAVGVGVMGTYYLNIGNDHATQLWLTSSLSPPVIAMSICMLVLFRRLCENHKLCGSKYVRVVAGLWPVTLGVYLIHPLMMTRLAFHMGFSLEHSGIGPILYTMIIFAASAVVVALLRCVPGVRAIL